MKNSYAVRCCSPVDESRLFSVAGIDRLQCRPRRSDLATGVHSCSTESSSRTICGGQTLDSLPVSLAYSVRLPPFSTSSKRARCG